MAKKVFLFGMFCIVFGLLLAGCDTGVSGGGGGGGATIDPDLVAKWYQTQAAADAGGTPLFEIATGGRLIGAIVTGEVTVTTSNKRISATIATGGAAIDHGSADYTVDNETQLTFSNPANGSIFYALCSVQATYYKAGSKTAKPTASPAAGAVASDTPVTLSTTTAGAVIHYTTDGSTPTASSTLYSDANKPTITGSTTIKAIAVKTGLTDSDILTADYTAVDGKVIAPTASPATGVVASGTQIRLSTLTSGATIRYTIDGNTPTDSSTQYTEAITINVTTTIKAIAVKTGMTSSAILTEVYTVPVAPSAPTNVRAEALSSSSITVSWNSVNGASKYYIYRGTSSGGENTKIGEVTFAPLYTDTGLSPSTKYYYKVSAYNSAGESSKSDSVNATTLSATNPFENTKWIATTSSFGAFMEFKDNTWVMGGSKAVKGTYTAAGNTARITVTDEWDDKEGWETISKSIVSTATLSGNTLTGSDDENNLMAFTKWAASGGSPNHFMGTWTGTVDGHNVTVNIDTTTVVTVGQAKCTYAYGGNTAVCTITDFWDNGKWQSVGTNRPPPYPVTVSGNKLTAYYPGSPDPITLTRGAGVPKTLVITGIPAAVWAYGVNGGGVALFPEGTSVEDAFNQQESGAVAGVSFEDDGNITSEQKDDNTYTLTIPLHIIGDGSTRWTGTGTYDVYVALLGDNGHYYKTDNVNFSAATTTIAFNSENELTLPEP
jgi:hypothetical protein